MSKFRKKHVEVDAHQWTGPECLGKVPGVRESFSVPVSRDIAGDPPFYMFNGTINGLVGKEMRIHPGDWVVTEANGDRFLMRNDSFMATYEEIKPNPPTEPAIF